MIRAIARNRSRSYNQDACNCMVQAFLDHYENIGNLSNKQSKYMKFPFLGADNKIVGWGTEKLFCLNAKGLFYWK